MIKGWLITIRWDRAWASTGWAAPLRDCASIPCKRFEFINHLEWRGSNLDEAGWITRFWAKSTRRRRRRRSPLCYCSRVLCNREKEKEKENKTSSDTHSHRHRYTGNNLIGTGTYRTVSAVRLENAAGLIRLSLLKLRFLEKEQSYNLRLSMIAIICVIIDASTRAGWR